MHSCLQSNISCGGKILGSPTSKISQLKSETIHTKINEPICLHFSDFLFNIVSLLYILHRTLFSYHLLYVVSSAIACLFVCLGFLAHFLFCLVPFCFV
jgi:hypothetical protein